MIEPGIIVNCYLGMIVQPLVHGLLDVRCYAMIGGRDMQHYRICHSMRFAQSVIYVHAIIAYRSTDVGTCRCNRPDERRVGTECDITGRPWWGPFNDKYVKQT